MTFNELKDVLENYKGRILSFVLGEESIPSHFHLTEIGKEVRDFVDCGGTKRKVERCVLQVWVANDFEHRLTSDKMLKIISLGEETVGNEELEVYFEYEKDSVSLYPVYKCEINEDTIKFYLGQNHTACLAPEKCGVECCTRG
jgi:hypothetical protein